MPEDHSTPRLPYAEVPQTIAAQIEKLGGRPLNLYRVLANAPRMLQAWVDFAYAIRRECKTPRSLRELLILRTAQLTRSEYEWHQHRIMGREAGVPEHKVAALERWRESPAFDEAEKAALALTDSMADARVDDGVFAGVARHFDPEEMIELALTIGFYCMVPRILSAIAVTTEGEPEGNA